MKRIKVKSSNIESIGYELSLAESAPIVQERLGTLEVEFRGGKVYQYIYVPETQYNQLMKAESIGKFFAANIKTGGYAFKKVEEVKEGSKRPLEAGASKARRVDPNAKNPFVEETEKNKWQEEFEDEIKLFLGMNGITLINSNIEKVFSKYIGRLPSVEGSNNIKVRIKCKDGMIQIERIHQ